MTKAQAGPAKRANNTDSAQISVTEIIHFCAMKLKAQAEMMAFSPRGLASCMHLERQRKNNRVVKQTNTLR